MALTHEEIEWLHENGYMPDWAYYQQNGKSATMNLHEQSKKIQEQALQLKKMREEAIKAKREQEKQEKQFQKQVDKELNEKIQKTLTDLLGNLAKQ